MSDAPSNPNKVLWKKGDFTRIAETMRGSGESLVRRIGVTKGLEVLDLGCGLFETKNERADATSIPATFLRVTVAV